MDMRHTTGAGGTPATGSKFSNSRSILSRPVRRKKPPYANQLKTLPAPNRALIIYTGQGAWDAAKRPLGYDGYFVVLPPGDDPDFYGWRIVRGSDAFILGFGEPEPINTIAGLGALLLAAGATLIVYSPERGPVTRIEAIRRAAA